MDVIACSAWVVLSALASGAAGDPVGLEVRRPDDGRRFATLSGPLFETRGGLQRSAASARSAALGPGVALRLGKLHPSGPSAASGDLIVGDDPQDELVVISGPFEFEGNIIVINQGRLLLNGAQARLRGAILAADQGRVEVRSSSLVFESSYLYQHTSVFAGQSQFTALGAQLHYEGGTHGLWLGGDASLNFAFVESNGALTAALNERASARLTQVDRAGEWVILGANELKFSQCNTIIPWLGFGAGTVADVSFPEGDLVLDFSYPEDPPGPEDPPWNLRVRECRNVLFTVMTGAGCDLTLRGSMVRAVGLIYEQSRFALSGLVNGQRYQSLEVPLDDRRIALRNAGVESWNVYPMEGSFGTIERSVLGEVLVMNSEAQIAYTLVDGTGGYLSTTGPAPQGSNALSSIFLSSFMSPLTVRSGAFTLLGLCGTPVGEMRVDQAGVLVALQTPLRVRPAVTDVGISFVGWLDAPVDPVAGTAVELSGTAVVDGGPLWPVDLAWYALEYTTPDRPFGWKPIASSNTEVWSGELGLWNTAGLEPGPYLLRLTLLDDLGNAVAVEDAVELEG